MAIIRFFVMGFASHQTWASGYQRASTTHDVRIEVISGERWKYRMMAACAEWEDKISLEDDILVVDGMFDVTVLVAMLRTRDLANNDPSNSNNNIRIPKVFVYFHENQFTTPFTSQDRDKKNNTHWHYGMAHWRSLLVADGFIFNSQTHFDAFAAALPKMINEQCPRDAVKWQLQRAKTLLKTKCTVLPYGLELDQLVQFQSKKRPRSPSSEMLEPSESISERVNILWNARLEEDKNPAAFLDLIHQIRRRIKGTSAESCPTQLIILGTDPSKDGKWENRIRKEFPPEMILYFGWCQDRKEYAQWLQKAHIVISTAKHETFGISIVESVFSGALPLLPKRLSYPELFPPEPFEQDHLYSNTRKDGVDKLLHLIDIIRNNPTEYEEAKIRAKTAVSTFRWANMALVYDQFFFSLAEGISITAAGMAAASTIKKQQQGVRPTEPDTGTAAASSNTDGNKPDPQSTKTEAILISKADDDRVALFRPKSLRNYTEYNRQVQDLKTQGIEVALHGGRRTTVRMLEAISLGAKIQPISFLTTRELADTLFLKDDKPPCVIPQGSPLYVTEDKHLLDEIRGQKLNTGDAILCMIQFPMTCPLEELAPPILLFDDVRNAENLGSILRTAYCLGIQSIIGTPTTWAALKDSRAARCSMGTMYYHRFYQTFDLAETIREIQKKGITVYGVEIGDNAVLVGPHGSNNNWSAVMGNEHAGLSPDIAKVCDKIVFVPQAHGDSLNVGHAAAITMFELGREGPKKDHDGQAACT